MSSVLAVALAAGLLWGAQTAAAASKPSFVPVAGSSGGAGSILRGTDGADRITLLPGPSLAADMNGDGIADVRAARGGSGLLVVAGGGGDDVIDARLSPVAVVLLGGTGDDVLRGTGGDDRLAGGPGNDVLDGAGQAGAASCRVSIDPATGQVTVIALGGDLADFSTSPVAVTVDLDPGETHPGTATSSEGTDTLQNVEHVIGSAFGDTISGDDEGNALLGGAGDDTIAGDAGADCVLGGDGSDTLDENEGTSLAQGGTGTANGADWLFGNAGADDTVVYSQRTTRVAVLLEPLLGGLHDGADVNGDGDADDSGDERDQIFLDTENAVGGAGNDVLSASFVSNRSDNELTGGGGNDRELGGAGNDAFHMGARADGADDLDGGTGADTCDYSARTAGVLVTLEGDDDDGEAGEGDNCGGVRTTGLPGEGQPSALSNVEHVLGGFGDDVLRGQPHGANSLSGGAGDDVLSGFGGSDSLSGGAGDDVVAGGSGSDAIDGGDGSDTADFASSGGAVRIDLASGRGSGQGADTLTAIENVVGSSFADSLTGNDGSNVLAGRGGNDAIQGAGGDDAVEGGDGDDEIGGGEGADRAGGGAGADTLSGNAGADTLAGGPGADTVAGGGGDDALSGDAGKDFVKGGAGTDRCNPGSPGLRRGDVVVGCER